MINHSKWMEQLSEKISKTPMNKLHIPGISIEIIKIKELTTQEPIP
jgi:hypothetical protein